MSCDVKTHVRGIILVLASNESQIVKNARKVWKQYMNIDPELKVFFVYGELSSQLEDYDASSDLIFPDIKESYPVYIKKTIEAMKLIHSKYTYDFFIRTNISTFWDFKKLHIHLNDLPKINCYSGDGPLPGYNSSGFYLSGTDTIVNYEMIESILQNTDKVNYTIVEDSAMGLYFNGVLKAPMLPNRICFFEDITSITNESKKQIEDRITHAISSNRDHYRVKSQLNREEIDAFIYNILLERVYKMNKFSHIEVVKCQYTKKRLGKPYDGGYVICDIPDVKYDLFLSGGIASDISFEEDFLRMYNIPCIAFDGTEWFDKSKFPDSNPNIQFICKNIGNCNTDTLTDLKEYLNDEKYSNIFMKLDIEGGEDDLFSILSKSELKKIRQLVIEFHSCYQKTIPDMLSDTHWLVHIHPNNCCGIGPNGIPDVFECTYILKTDRDIISKYDDPIPNPNIDMANNGGVDDIIWTGNGYIKR